MRGLSRIRRLRWVLLLALAGCGTDPKAGPSIEVTGRLLDDGKPLAISTAGLSPGTPPVRVEFLPTEPGGSVVQATVNPADATFVVRGYKGAPLRPGKYKVALSMGPLGGDKFDGKFAAEKTPIVRELAAGQEVVIDVAKP